MQKRFFYAGVLLAAAVPVLMLSNTPYASTPMLVKQHPASPELRNVSTDARAMPGSAKAEHTTDRAFAMAGWGQALLERGKPDAAIRQFHAALRLNKEVSTAYLGLAQAYSAQGKNLEAAQAYRILMYNWPGKRWGSSIATEPHNLMQFALVLQKLNKRSEAATVYQRAYQFSETPLQTYLYQIPASGNYDPVRLEASVRLVLADRYEQLSSFRNRDKTREKQIAELRKVIAAIPSDANAHYSLAMALGRQAGYLHKPVPAEALAEFKQAARLGTGKVRADAERYALALRHSALSQNKVNQKQ